MTGPQMAGWQDHTWQDDRTTHGRVTGPHMAGWQDHTWQGDSTTHGRVTGPHMAGWQDHTWSRHDYLQSCRSCVIANGRCAQGMSDLSKVYLPELLERVSAGEALEADSNLSTCINFTVFSFVIPLSHKNTGDLFGCNFTFCVPNQHLWFSKFPIFKNIWIYQIRF